MSRYPLTDAMKDSHRVTLRLHQEAADRARNEGNWSGAVTALQLALPHANAIGDRELKKFLFAGLNIARARARADTANRELVKTIETEAANAKTEEVAA